MAYSKSILRKDLRRPWEFE